MKNAKLHLLVVLVAVALQGCANGVGTGSAAVDSPAQPTQSATSPTPAAAPAPTMTKVEDVKKGTVLTGGPGGGVNLHGFWHSAPLPLPPGNWEVVVRTYESVTWKTALRKPTLKFLWMALKNQDPKAHIQWIQVSSNIDTDRVGYLKDDCVGNYEVVNDFGTTASALIQRCGYATYVENHRPPMEFAFSLMRDPDIQSRKVIEVRLVANRGSGRLTQWAFFVVPPPELASAEERKTAIIRFLQETGDQVKEFLYNRPALLPDRLALPP